jgi:hypothetical protein
MTNSSLVIASSTREGDTDDRHPNQQRYINSQIRSTARGNMWAALSGTFCIETKMEMPATFCRARYFSTFLYGNGNIATA